MFTANEEYSSVIVATKYAWFTNTAAPTKVYPVFNLLIPVVTDAVPPEAIFVAGLVYNSCKYLLVNQRKKVII